MKLSTKGRYAMRAMLDLSLHYGEGPILLKDIAKREHISERYLEQIILLLKAAGLVNSTRGARGGFILTKLPSQIRLIEVMQVSEGSLVPVEDGDQVYIETKRGRIKQRAVLTVGINPGVVGVSYCWWFPEQGIETLHGWRESNINILTESEPPYNPQIGPTNLRGILCRVYKVPQ